MTGWIGIAAGLALLALVFSDRRRVREAWRSPARWWKGSEYMESREPSQPLNVILGTLLGTAGIAYGIAMLIS